MNNYKYAPVVLFTFQRLDFLDELVRGLRANSECSKTILYVFSDGPKGDDVKSIESVKRVREYIKTITGFKELVIKESILNKGLRNSITEGLNEVFRLHDNAIILEDDTLVTSNFLAYMNSALAYYQNAKKVWHINGWSTGIRDDLEQDLYFSKVMNCWGWATWRDKWELISFDTNRRLNSWSYNMKRDFDLNWSGVFWYQLKDNHFGRSKTWAIFWYATIFENEGLCLTPAKSLVRNVGFDGSGTHKSKENVNTSRINDGEIIDIIVPVKEDSEEERRLIKYYRSSNTSSLRRIVSWVYRLMR